MMIFFNLVIFILSFLGVWFSAGLIINGIERFSRKLNISAFATSFFILGILTSLPELTVGINSVLDKEPEIFVGNLIGASFVLFVLVIPILAIFGNGITLAHHLSEKNLILSLFVVFTPVIFVMDGRIGRVEGIFMILIYLILFYFIEKKKGLLERVLDNLSINGKGGTVDFFKIILGAILIFLSSKFLVDKTIYFAQLLGISTFLISLLFLSVGTNLPELFVAIKSIVRKRKEVAFGDYVGSAAANTLLFGILAFFNGPFVIEDNSFVVTFILFLAGLLLFYWFSRSKNDISRKEGFVLFTVYIMFLILEFVAQIFKNG